MKAFSLIVLSIAFMGGLMGCVSASTEAKVCADLSIAHKIVGGVNTNAGQTLADYTPAKCVGASVSGDTSNMTGGVTAGITNK